MPTYQFIKALLRSTSDLEIDNEHLMVISPDEGAMNRTMYFSSVLGVDIGMFYKEEIILLSLTDATQSLLTSS